MPSSDHVPWRIAETKLRWESCDVGLGGQLWSVTTNCGVVPSFFVAASLRVPDSVKLLAVPGHYAAVGSESPH
jgi:hypothetical protein